MAVFFHTSSYTEEEKKKWRLKVVNEKINHDREWLKIQLAKISPNLFHCYSLNNFSNTVVVTPWPLRVINITLISVHLPTWQITHIGQFLQ